MDYVFQQAMDNMRKEMAIKNPSGAISALTDALKICDKESDKQIYFELGKLQFSLGNSQKGVEMFCKALEVGFNEQIITNFILRAYFAQDKIADIYMYNLKLLSTYPNCSFVNDLLKITMDMDNFYLYCDDNYVITANQKKELFITTPKAKEYSETTNVPVYCILNPKNISQIIKISEAYSLVHKRKIPLYLIWFDKKELIPILTYMKLDSLLEDRHIEFLVGLENVQKYFSDIQTFLPTHILDYTENEEGTNIIKDICRQRHESTKKTIQTVTEYYKDKQDAIYQNFTGNQIKLLLFASRFDESSFKLVNTYASASHKMKYKTASLSEKSDLSFKDNMEILILEKTVPNTVITFNSFRYQRTGFPQEIIFITFISDLAIINYDELAQHVCKNDFIVASAVDYNKLVSIGIPRGNLIRQPRISGYFNTLSPINEAKNDVRFKLFECDVCLVANYKSKASVLNEILHLAKTHYDDSQHNLLTKVLADIDEKYLSHFFVEQIPLTLMRNISILKEIFDKNSLDISSELLNSLAEQYVYNLFPVLYTANILNWLIRSGIENIKIWGDGWNESPQFKSYYAGSVTDNNIFTKALIGAKIVVNHQLRDTDYLVLYSAISCNCLYFQNNYFDRRDVIKKDLGLVEGEHLDYFSNKETFLKKISNYIANPKKIEAMAKVARANIKIDSVSAQVLKYVFSNVSDAIHKIME